MIILLVSVRSLADRKEDEADATLHLKADVKESKHAVSNYGAFNSFLINNISHNSMNKDPRSRRL